MAKAKTKISYVCSDCGADYTKWQGQCGECKAWNTITEFREASSTSKSVNAAINRNQVGGYAGLSLMVLNASLQCKSKMHNEYLLA